MSVYTDEYHYIKLYVASCRPASKNLTDLFNRRSYDQQDSLYRRHFRMSIEFM